MKSFAHWLTEIGLDRYAAIFSENKIDFHVVCSLSEVDLRELGLALGDRKRLLQAMASWTGKAPQRLSRRPRTHRSSRR